MLLLDGKKRNKETKKEFIFFFISIQSFEKKIVGERTEKVKKALEILKNNRLKVKERKKERKK